MTLWTLPRARFRNDFVRPRRVQVGESTGRSARRLVTPPTASKPPVYFNFFLGRSWLVWPHFFLRQLTARGCRRA